MHADSIDARLQQPFIEGIKQLFIIHPPWVDGQMLVGIVANRIALEAIGLELFDGTLHLLHPAWPTGRENGVRQNALGAGGVIHALASIELHVIGQEPVNRFFRRCAADQRYLGIRIKKHFLEPACFHQILNGLFLADQIRIPPRTPHRAARIHEGHDARIRAQEMRMHIHDELVLQRRSTRCRRIRLLRLSTAHGIKRAMDFIHGQEGGRHAGSGLQKATPAQPLLGTDFIRHFLDACFDRLLFFGLRHRPEFIG